jgi:hypothetical protein
MIAVVKTGGVALFNSEQPLPEVEHAGVPIHRANLAL